MVLIRFQSVVTMTLLLALCQNGVGQTNDSLLPVSKKPQKVSETGTSQSQNNDSIKIEKSVLKILEQRQIPSRSSGIIKQSDIREGTLVDVGQSIMLIDSARVELEVEKIQIELETAAKQAQSTVDLEYATKSKQVAEVELKRAQESNERVAGLFTESEMDRLQLLVEKSAAEVKKAQFAMDIASLQSKAKNAELKIQKLDLEYHKILAPMNGMIVEVIKRPGEWVDVSQPVAKLVRLDILKTEVKIPADLATRQKLIGRRCWFQPELKSLQDNRYPAKVVFVNPDVNPVNSTCRAWIEIENKALELRPGMLGTVEIELMK